MKTKFVSKIFFLFICFCAFASSTVAQDKPQAIEVVEIGVKTGDTEIDKLTETLEKFISRLEKEPATTIGYIDTPVNTELGKKIKLFVANAGLENRVKFWGTLRRPEGYRFPFGFSFYLVPQGAKIPYRCIIEPCECPDLSIEAFENAVNRKSFLHFTAKIAGGDIQGTLSYKWTVSAGKIVEGHGTLTIKVDAEGAKEITATVEIEGVCHECPREATFTTKIQ